MIQREDIVLIVGAASGMGVIYLGHLNEGLALITAGLIGKGVIPNIAPTVVATPAAVQGAIVTIGGKNYVTQPDGSLKPQ